MNDGKRRVVFLLISGINIIASFVFFFFSICGVYAWMLNRGTLVDLLILLTITVLPGLALLLAGIHAYQLKSGSYRENIMGCWIFGILGLLLMGMAGFAVGDHPGWAYLGHLGFFCFLLAWMERILLLTPEVKNKLA